jgi:hypothetical protein
LGGPSFFSILFNTLPFYYFSAKLHDSSEIKKTKETRKRDSLEKKKTTRQQKKFQKFQLKKKKNRKRKFFQN